MKNILKKIAKSIIVMSIVLLMVPMPIRAAEVNRDGMNNSSFSGNMQKRANYYLDLEECDLFETGYSLINGIANMLFALIKTVGYLTCCLFYYAMDFDVTGLLSEQINSIQQMLKTEVFNTLFILGFMGAGVSALTRLIRRDLMGAGQEIAKGIIIMILAVGLSRHSTALLTAGNDITKEAGIRILNAMTEENAGNNKTDYAKNTAELLWNNLVHKPWVSLEFGTTEGVDGLANTLLGYEPSAEKRTQLVANNSSYFTKTCGGERIGAMLAYLIPFFGKCALYIAIVVIQCVFQALGILFLLMGLLVLAVAMIPGYNFDFIGIWLKKILENQFSILLLMLMMGFLIKIDNAMLALTGSMGGWLVVSTLQMIILVGVFLCRKQILGGFTKVQRGVANAGYAKAKLRNAGNVFTGVEAANRSGTIMANNVKRNVSQFASAKMEERRTIATDRIEETSNQQLYANAVQREEKQESDRVSYRQHTDNRGQEENTTVQRPNLTRSIQEQRQKMNTTVRAEDRKMQSRGVNTKNHERMHNNVTENVKGERVEARRLVSNHSETITGINANAAKVEAVEAQRPTLSLVKKEKIEPPILVSNKSDMVVSMSANSDKIDATEVKKPALRLDEKENLQNTKMPRAQVMKETTVNDKMISEPKRYTENRDISMQSAGNQNNIQVPGTRKEEKKERPRLNPKSYTKSNIRESNAKEAIRERKAAMK